MLHDSMCPSLAKYKAILYLLCCLFGCNTAIKIFESSVHLEVENLISGLRYKRPNDEKVMLSNSLTVCIRFNLKRLGYGESVKLNVKIVKQDNETRAGRNHNTLGRFLDEYRSTWK